MEEEMMTLCNIMPVELAIKRELEYRKKMEQSKNRHQNDLKPLVPAQVPVFESQTVVDRKRKVQPCNAQSSRAHLSCARFICVACKMAFATVFHLQMHGETSAHNNKLHQSKSRGQNVSNPFLCELCDILCSSGRVMELHVAGFKHGSFLQLEDAKRARIHGNIMR